jgi:hypothetical protein
MPFSLQLALILSMLTLTTVTAFAETCEQSDLYRVLQATITKRTQLETTLAEVSDPVQAFTTAENTGLDFPGVREISGDESEATWQDFNDAGLEALHQFDVKYGAAVVEQLKRRTIEFDLEDNLSQLRIYSLYALSNLNLLIASKEELAALKTAIQQAYEASEMRVEENETTAPTAASILSLIDEISNGKYFVRQCEVDKLNELLQTSFSESINRFCDRFHPANRPVDVGLQCRFGVANAPPTFLKSEIICALENIKLKSVTPIPSFQVRESYWQMINGWKWNQRFHLDATDENGRTESITLRGSEANRYQLFMRMNDVD